jgi:hypothetical protein
MNTTESRTFAARLADLLKNERHAMAAFLVALAEFDRKRGWLELGFSNLFDFLHRDLGLSKGTAFYRKLGAELIQAYPEIVEPLRDGRLCVTALHALSRAITPQNRAEVLPRFFHRSKQEARELAAELAPAPVVPRREVVTVVRASSPAAGAVASTPQLILEPEAPAAATSSQDSQPVGSCSREGAPVSLSVTPAPRLVVEPLTATERRVHITVSPAFLEKLEAARLALSHSMPGADAEDVLSAGLDLVLERDAKRKGLVAKPRPAPVDAPATPGAVYIPAAVRREVWERDQGCCQWRLDSGEVCGSKIRTELDHIQLRCRGGRPIAEDLRVLCHFHNQSYARLTLGDALMDRYTRDPRRPEPVGLVGDASSE